MGWSSGVADQVGATDHGALTGLADDDHTAYATDAALTTHEGDTSSVHGVTDTTVLETVSGAAAQITTHAGLADPHTGYVLESSHNAAWTTFVPDWTGSITNPDIGNGTRVGAYLIQGKTLHFRISVSAGSTTTFGTGNWGFTLPGGFVSKTGGIAQPLLAVARDTGVAVYIGPARVDAGATTFNVGVNASANQWSVTAPHAWGNGDAFYISGTIEVD